MFSSLVKERKYTEYEGWRAESKCLPVSVCARLSSTHFPLLHLKWSSGEGGAGLGGCGG